MEHYELKLKAFDNRATAFIEAKGEFEKDFSCRERERKKGIEIDIFSKNDNIFDIVVSFEVIFIPLRMRLNSIS